jgi:UDP-glucose 4-epimerase
MKVLITGNKGFIGQEIEKKLRINGIQTVGYDIVDNLDILDTDTLTAKVSVCDAIIHLAAIETQFSHQVMQTNVLGTWSVLCAGINADIKKIVYLSSVDALGIFQGESVPKYLPIDDNYPCHPKTAYSISKKLSEDLCKYFSLSYNLSIICLRPPGVWNKSTYFDICAERKKRPSYEWDPYWEYGAFIDIRDLSEAVFLSLLKDLKGFNCFLVASDDITTSGKTSLELKKQIFPNIKWNGGDEYEVEPYKALVLSENAKKQLDWIPKYTWKGFCSSQMQT